MSTISLEPFWQDVRFALRTLRKTPGFLAVVILSLALGIGANSIIFSVLDAALYRPLPYPYPNQLMVIWDTQPNRPESRQSPPIAELNDWQKANHVFQDIALTSGPEDSVMVVNGEAQRIMVQNVTPNYFSLLGARPRFGRVFLAEEMQDKSIAVVLSDAFWRTKFSGDPNVLGKTFDMEGSVATVVGVMPPGFGPIAGERLDLWQPVDPKSARFSDRIDHWLIAIGRLKPGVTETQAQLEMNIIARGIADAYPKTNKGVGEKVQELRQVLQSFAGTYLYPLLGAVVCILLIGCLNVANLMQSRTEGRRREYALRSALGADRGRLMQQMLVESGVLAGLGCVAGILLTFVGIPIFRVMAGDFTFAQPIAIEGRVLLFTLGISILTAVLFGLVPAWQTSRTDPNGALRAGERGNIGKAHGFVGRLLAISEIALAMVLLVGAGLMIDSVLRLQDVNPGFDSRNMLMAQINLPEGGKYVERVPGGDMEKWTPNVDAFYRELLQKLSALPGVASASLASAPPLGMAREFAFTILGHPVPRAEDRPRTGYGEVSAGYFEMLRIPLRHGRLLNEHDTPSSQWTVVINEALARKYFPNEDPIGQQIRLRFEPYPIEEDRPRQIIGVVADVKNAGLNHESWPFVYVSSLQQQSVLPGGTILVHTSQSILLKMKSGDKGLESQTFSAMRQGVAEIDPNVPLLDPMTLDGLRNLVIGDFRFYRNLFGLFAGIALLLAVIGIYGVMSHFVSARTREIGIRMALGARPGDVVELIGGVGLKLGAIGVVLGAALAAGLTRLIATFLYGVKPTDPATYAIVGVGLVVVALAACLIPARRALKVDPMIALRHE
jgi:predicted permease